MKRYLAILGLFLTLCVNAQKSQRLDCILCETQPKGCNICDDVNKGEVFNGLVVYNDGAVKKIYKPYKIHYTGSFVQVSDAYGNSQNIYWKKTKYGNVSDLLAYLADCSCKAGSVASFDETLTSYTLDPNPDGTYNATYLDENGNSSVYAIGYQFNIVDDTTLQIVNHNGDVADSEGLCNAVRACETLTDIRFQDLVNGSYELEYDDENGNTETYTFRFELDLRDDTLFIQNDIGTDLDFIILPEHQSDTIYSTVGGFDHIDNDGDLFQYLNPLDSHLVRNDSLFLWDNRGNETVWTRSQIDCDTVKECLDDFSHTTQVVEDGGARYLISTIIDHKGVTHIDTFELFDTLTTNVIVNTFPSSGPGRPDSTRFGLITTHNGVTKVDVWWDLTYPPLEDQLIVQSDGSLRYIDNDGGTDNFIVYTFDTTYTDSGVNVSLRLNGQDADSFFIPMCGALPDTIYYECNPSDSVFYSVFVDREFDAFCSVFTDTIRDSLYRCVDFCQVAARDTKVVVTSQRKFRFGLDSLSTILSSINTDEKRYGIVLTETESSVNVDKNGLLEVIWDETEFALKDTLTVDWYVECKSNCTRDTARFQICREVIDCMLDYQLDGSVFVLNGIGAFPDAKVSIENTIENVTNPDPSCSPIYAQGSFYNPSMTFAFGETTVLCEGIYNVTIELEDGSIFCCSEVLVVDPYTVCETDFFIDYAGPSTGLGSQPCYTIPISPFTEELFAHFTTYDVADSLHVYYNGATVLNTGAVSTFSLGQTFAIDIPYVNGINEVTVCIAPDPNTSESQTFWALALSCCPGETRTCPDDTLDIRIAALRTIAGGASCRDIVIPVASYPLLHRDPMTGNWGTYRNPVGFTAYDPTCNELLGNEMCTGSGFTWWQDALQIGLPACNVSFGGFPCFNALGTTFSNQDLVNGLFFDINFTDATAYNNFKNEINTSQIGTGTSRVLYDFFDATCLADKNLITRRYFLVTFQGNFVWSFDDLAQSATYDISPYIPVDCCEEFYYNDADNGAVMTFSNTGSIDMVVRDSIGSPGTPPQIYRWNYTTSCGTTNLIYQNQATDRLTDSIIHTWSLQRLPWQATGGDTIFWALDWTPTPIECESRIYSLKANGENFNCFDARTDVTILSFDLTSLGGGAAESGFADFFSVRDRIRTLTGDNGWQYDPEYCAQFVNQDGNEQVIAITIF